MQDIEQAFTNFLKFYRKTPDQHVAISELFGALSFWIPILFSIHLIGYKHIDSHLLQHNNELPKDNLARLCRVSIENTPFSLVEEPNSAPNIFGITAANPPLSRRKEQTGLYDK